MTRPPPFRPTATRSRLTGLLGLPAVLAMVSACAPLQPVRHDPEAAANLLRAELAPLPARSTPIAAAPAAPAAVPPTAPTAAPAAPATAAAPRPAPATEPRFDLIVNGAHTRDVFLSLVADTPYSMLLHPEVEGQLSLTLRGVTLREALESIRDVHGFEFRIEGRRITVYPPRMQTRIFSVNHLNTRRQGRSEVRVSGGSAPAGTPNNGSSGSNGSSSGQTAPRPDASEVTSTSNADYWTEVVEVLKGIVGNGQGRHVIVSAHAGTIAVRGMPDELRQVQAFLQASRLAIERQVMLEAKIIEVELRDGHKSGIDWSYLGRDGAIGQTGGYAGNPLLGNAGGLPTLPAAVVGAMADALGVPAGSGGTLGLALASKGFQAVMGFLETHGDVQVLSSPRIATLNNQKAVLKVGVDDYFLTNVSGGSTNSTTTSSVNNNGGTSLPSLTLTPFFSGVALDVTPQIDDTGMITLHVRPSVTSVTEKTRQIDLGAIGNYRLPLASSSVNESDTVVRVPDGQIVAIGGLMQSESSGRASGLPGAQGNAVTSTLFSNKAREGRKKELVVLIRPTIIRDAEDWERATTQALGHLDPREPRRVITVAPAAKAAVAPVAPVAPAAHVAPAAAGSPGATASPAVSAQPAVTAVTAAPAVTPVPAVTATPPAAVEAAVIAAPTRPQAGTGRSRPRRVVQRLHKPATTAAKPATPPVTAPPPAPAPAVVAEAAPPTLLARLWPMRW